MSYCVKKAKERKFMIKREFDSFFFIVRHIVRGNQYMFYMHFGDGQILEKSCSIHGQLNRFSMDWNNELYTEFFGSFFGGKT